MQTKRNSKKSSKLGGVGGFLNRSKRKDSKPTDASIETAEHEEKLKDIYKTLTKQKKTLQSKANKSSGKDRREYIDLRDKTVELRVRVKMALSDLHNEPVIDSQISNIERNFDSLLRKVARKR